MPALAAAGAVGGVYWFYRGFRRFEGRRLLLNILRSEIHTASMGLVEVGGLATGPVVITSPLRQVECFYYRSLAWELRHEGGNRGWVKIADECVHVPFYIDDGTGRLLVDPRGAKIDAACNLKGELGRPPLSGPSGMPAGAGQFLSRYGANFSRRLRVEEYSIQPKNSLFVLGTLAENPVANSGSVKPHAAVPSGRGGGATRPFSGLTGTNVEIVRLSPDAAPQSAAEMTQQQRLASALMKAGIRNPVASKPGGVNTHLAKARSHSASAPGPARDAAGGKAVSSGFDPLPAVVLRKGADGSPFTISSKSQRDLARSAGWKSTLAIWGGPILTLVALSILLAHFYGW